MNLDPQIAETIVTNLKDVINHEINLFDTTGTIIASTDRTRIGTSHDGARLAIKTKKTISIDRENEYRGARHGINVPVMFNDQVVAVIGITGERSEVEPFGNVIKKMTEILIRENWDSVVRYDHRTRISSLVGMLKLKRHDANLVAYHASLMRIDLNLPRFCVVGRIRSDCEEVADYNSLYTMLHARFQQMRTSFFAFMDHEVCLFVDAREMRALPALLEGIRQDGVRVLHHHMAFGVGRVMSSGSEYWRSYEEACRAVEWLEFTHAGFVENYEDMDLGLIVSSAAREDAQQLVERVFGDLPEEEVDEFQTVFDAYTRHNGSIARGAEELYLHKNTLQNRLNKIASKTGYNPRHLDDYAVLSIAFVFRRYLKELEKGA